MISLPPTILNSKSSPSTSIPNRLIESELSSLKLTLDTVSKIGASLTELIVILMIPSSAEDSPLSSITENEIKSSPK